MNGHFDLDRSIAAWRRTLEYNRAFLRDDVDELESHLRDHVEVLVRKGRSEETAFHEALRRLGDYGSVEAEYRKVFWIKLTHRRGILRELLWEATMLKNYVKIALRNLLRHKGTSFINVSGLAIGMACCLVVLFYVRDELRYDQYHEKGDQLYRLSLNVTALSSGEGGPAATSSILWGPAMKRDFPEVVDYARFVSLQNPDAPWIFRHGEQVFTEQKALFADPSALTLFSWPLVQGDPATALAKPHAVVLTESMAAKYFGDEDPMGKVLEIRLRDENGNLTEEAYPYTVTGVLKDIPRNSHFTFDFLLSFIDLNGIYGGDVYSSENLDSWFWRGRIAYTYVLLRPGADRAALEAKFPDFLERYVGDATRVRGYTYDLFLQPLPDIYLAGNFDSQLAPAGDLDDLYLFSIIALFILLIACINFMNLATARSAGRAKEVGMRKVVGARRKQLISQFLSESIIITLMAMVLAVVLAWLLLPIFYQYLGKEVAFDPGDSAFFLASLLGVTLVVGVLAGSYPAFFLSRFLPAQVLKGTFTGAGRAALLRKGLVVFQFAISAFLIIGTTTVFNQLRYMRNAPLGFNQEYVLVLPPGVGRSLMPHYETLKAELLQRPQILNVTGSSGMMAMGTTGDIYNEKGTSPDEGISIADSFVDYNFIDMFGLDLIAGRDFSRDIALDEGFRENADGQAEVNVIVNEETVRRFGWPSPEAALGRQIVRDPKSADFIGTIVGVVKDFHVESLRAPIRPLALVRADRYSYLSIQLQAKALPETIAFIQGMVKDLAPDADFTYRFLDEAFNEQYQREERLGEIFSYISFLAIFIACLGLFGLAAFTAEQRTKEIGVRKVLGASTPGLVALLSKDFLKLVLVGTILAAPMAYFAMNRWLEDFAYRVEISWRIFLIAGLAALLIALLTVSYQALRAALADPVESLRYE